VAVNDVNKNNINPVWICIIVLLCDPGATRQTIVVHGFSGIDEVSEFAHYYKGYFGSKKEFAVKSVKFRQKDRKPLMDERIISVEKEQFKKIW
jgi:hypothetical protein